MLPTSARWQTFGLGSTRWGVVGTAYMPCWCVQLAAVGLDVEGAFGQAFMVAFAHVAHCHF
jgi:hypothetical protein